MKTSSAITKIETPLATCWIEKGFFCIETKNEKRTPQTLRTHYETIGGIVKQPLLWMVHLTFCHSYDEASLSVMKKTIPKLCTAMAIIATSPCEPLVSNYFKPVKLWGIPLEVFTSKEEAIRWLKNRSQKENLEGSVDSFMSEL